MTEYTIDNDEHITFEAIDNCNNPEQLKEWYEDLVDLSEEIKAFVSSYRFVKLNDEPWFKRAGGKIAVLKLRINHIERALTDMDQEIPRHALNPLVIENRNLVSQNKKLKGLLKDLGHDLLSA